MLRSPSVVSGAARRAAVVSVALHVFVMQRFSGVSGLPQYPVPNTRLGDTFGNERVDPTLFNRRSDVAQVGFVLEDAPECLVDDVAGKVVHA